jgi:hypothetical protein
MPTEPTSPAPRKTARAVEPITIDLLGLKSKLQEIREHHGLSAAGMIRTLIAREFDEIRRIPD